MYGAILLFQRNNPTRLAFVSPPERTIMRPMMGITPVAITIKQVKINLALYPATIQNNQWPTTTKGISYLASSPIPGQKGNSIIYGHNWKSLFGPLQNTKPGDEVEITYKDSSKKKFTMLYTSIVSPEQVNILQPSKDTRITMYTCTGFLDSQRFVAVAILNK